MIELQAIENILMHRVGQFFDFNKDAWTMVAIPGDFHLRSSSKIGHLFRKNLVQRNLSFSHTRQIDYVTNYNNLLTNFLHSNLSLTTSSSRYCFSLWVSSSILLRKVILRPLPCFPPVFDSQSKIWVVDCGELGSLLKQCPINLRWRSLILVEAEGRSWKTSLFATWSLQFISRAYLSNLE